MAVTLGGSAGSSTWEDVLRSRNRVVDHWKWLFAIICGFAITVACLRAYTCFLVPDLPGILQFMALIVTIPPIFHGMERSLDLRYLQPTSAIPGAVRMIVDTSILTITALLFLGLALSIPDFSQRFLVERQDTLRHWYLWLFVSFFWFDVLVLWGTSYRFDLPGVKKSHYALAVLNLVTGVAIALVMLFDPFAAWISTGFEPGQPTDSTVLLPVAIIAGLRSVLDYWIGRKFLYPQESHI
jgi:hypothetical protein